MSNIIDTIIRPAWDKLDVRYIVDAERPRAVAVFPIDAATGIRTIVTAQAFDEQHDLQIWATVCQVSAPRRAAVLAVINDLNAGHRYLKWALNGELVTLERDLDLAFSTEPEAQFAWAFVGLMEYLRQTWQRIVRAASKRSSRSRLDRELDAILHASKHSTDSPDHD